MHIGDLSAHVLYVRKSSLERRILGNRAGRLLLVDAAKLRNISHTDTCWHLCERELGEPRDH